MTHLRDVWEATSFELDKLQANPECVLEEQRSLKTRKTPNWQLTFDVNQINISMIFLLLNYDT